MENMNDIYLYFGSQRALDIEQEILKSDIRQNAYEQGEGIAEMFDISSAQPNQLKHFSYLVGPQGASFLENEQSLEQHLDMLENSADIEKILAVLALSGHTNIPLQFLQAIHHLYQYNEEDGVALPGEIHYQPNIESHLLFGVGALEESELESNFDIPSLFVDAGEWTIDTQKQMHKQDDGEFAAELVQDFVEEA